MELQRKKHLFKSRKNKYTKKQSAIIFGSLGLYNIVKFRYELVYLRFLKKFLRQKHIRKKVAFSKKKF